MKTIISALTLGALALTSSGAFAEKAPARARITKLAKARTKSSGKKGYFAPMYYPAAASNMYGHYTGSTMTSPNYPSPSGR